MSGRRKLQTRRKAFWMLLSSSFIVALVPLVVSIAMSLLLLFSRADLVERNYQSAADSISKAFTNARGTVYGQFSAMAGNETIQEYSTERTRRYWTELRIHDMLMSNLSTNSAIRSAFVYLRQFDTILSAGNNLSSENYWRMYSAEEAEVWKTLLEKAETVPQMTVLADSVALTETIRETGDGVCKAVLVFVLDKKAVCDSVMTAAVDSRDQLAVYLGDSVYMTTFPDESKIVGADREDAFSLDGRTYRVYAPLSRTGPFRILYFADTGGSMMRRSDPALIVMCIALGALLTTVLCVVMALRNYSPLQRIMEMLDIKYVGADEDEYENIVQKVLQSETQLSAMKQTMNAHANEFQTMYLEKLLLGKVRNPALIDGSMELYNIRFPQKYICLLLVDTEASIDAKYEDTDAGRLIFTVAELISAMLTESDVSYMLELNTLPAFLINSDRERDLLEQIDEMFASLRSLLSIPIVYAARCAPADKTMLSSLYRETLAEMENGTAEEKGEPEAQEKALDPNVETCVTLIARSYKDADFGVAEMAQELGINPSYLSRCFKQQIGIGPLEYMNRYRINVARAIMDREPNILLRDLAIATGFRSEATLIRAFKKYEGRTPGQYRTGRGDLA